MLPLRQTPILAAILAATFAGASSASVICEYEPTLGYDDCRSCFKADADGIGLYLNGELRAFSTSPSRAPTLPVDGRLYSLGLEKKAVSRLNGKSSVFEFCYEKFAPTVAGSVTLRMSEPDFGEFDLEKSLPGIGSARGIELAGTVAGGEASIFGASLVFMPDDDWQGRAAIPYRVHLADGRSSEPGLITILSPGAETLEERAQRKAQLDQARRDAELVAQLTSELADLQASLLTEVTSAGELRSRIGELLQEIEQATDTLEMRSLEIERLEAIWAAADAERESKSRAALADAKRLEWMDWQAQQWSFRFEPAVIGGIGPLSPLIEAGDRAPVHPGRENALLRLVWCRRLMLGVSLEEFDAPEGVVQRRRRAMKRNNMRMPQAAKSKLQLRLGARGAATTPLTARVGRGKQKAPGKTRRGVKKSR